VNNIFIMRNIIHFFIPIIITTTIGMLIILNIHTYAAGQSNINSSNSSNSSSKRGGGTGTSSIQGQGMPGAQENANPLTQAPISGIKAKPPNNATAVPPLEKANITGTTPP
jgi:hypothetical protein